MKKIITLIFVLTCITGIAKLSASTTNAVTPTSAPTEKPLSSEEVTKLTLRYQELKDTDNSNLSSAERKSNRNEAADIKATLKAQDQTVLYISSGVVIVVLIILLIILL